VPVPKVNVVDTVGAGDSFFGAVLSYWDSQGFGRAQLSDSRAVVGAVEFGVAISGITCGRTGADPPRIAELTPALQAKVS
jgi:fructokinase